MFKFILKIFIFSFVAALATTSFCSAATSTVSLPVPFVVEIPDGLWIKPWNNACEEAAVTMVNQYYFGTKKITKAESKKMMWPLFGIEDKIFGTNQDTDAAHTARLANEYLSFQAKIITDPALEQIKAELDAGRPVISMHYGFGLNNPLLRFRRAGSSYHMMVISGYDDAAEAFIVEDPGHERGLDFRYKYATIMGTLHDFDYKRSKADGPARVLFTKRYALVRAEGGRRIYLIDGNEKRYIAHPDLVKKHGLKWSNLKEVKKDWLDSFPSGEVIWE